VETTDYKRIETAIAYLAAHVREQPTLEVLAAQVHLSPWHFQRLFCRWAGISPKRFLQALTLEQSKGLLQTPEPLEAIAGELGLSGSSRLHDHYVQLEALSPGEYRRQGEGIAVAWGTAMTPYGEMFLASTARGICRAGFTEAVPLDEQLSALRGTWPQCRLERRPAMARDLVSALFAADDARDTSLPVSLHVSGTNFQIAVWRALLQVPAGRAVSYGELARAVGRPGASRAVGSAVGANPVALWIPCHRVIQQSGALGGYRWGVARKRAIRVREWLRGGAHDSGALRESAEI
jgi:AraC family transcriptional regulator of adaptative response/methylated-DNA-[protein]-cysteine methyltransferase